MRRRRVAAVGAQEMYGVVGKDAVGARPVGDDLLGGEFALSIG
ncbi:MAG TPA: hypothetical protein VHT50_08510 [Mycobacterium sp.]|nr:hypothetical protein [Mycobacterium sp.]